MAIISHEMRLAYFDVPKIACTTLKTVFWEVEHGRSVPDKHQPIHGLIARLGKRPAGGKFRIHFEDGYRTLSFQRAQQQDIPAEYEKFTVVRDPIARLYSAWSNKANPETLKKSRETEDLLNEGLSIAPSFTEFLRDYELYRAVSRPVRVHAFPLSWHLGPTIRLFDRVFRIEDMAQLETYLSDRGERKIVLRKANQSARSPAPVDLSTSDKAALLAYTRADYEWLEGLYDPQAGLAKLTG